MKKREKGVKKKKMYQNSLIKNQNNQIAIIPFLLFSQVFECSYYQRLNAATINFRKFGIVSVSSVQNEQHIKNNNIQSDMYKQLFKW